MAFFNHNVSIVQIVFLFSFKLLCVMGVKWDECDSFQRVKDPDPSYELTMDNLLKIIAIYMRLRANIPVIIMGETGCGK